MKSPFSSVAIFFILSCGLLLAGCSPDFNVEDEVFHCSDDDDCLQGNSCVDGFCEPGTSEDDDVGPDVPDEPDECDPSSEDYPLDEPLDIQEVCDGEDNNCDGEVDVIYCEHGCPAVATDPEGNQVDYVCDESFDPPRCIAETFDKFTCPDPLNCVDGQLEVVPEECQ